VLCVYVCVYAGLGCEPQLRAIQFAVLWVDVEFAEHGTIIGLAIIAIDGTKDDALGGAVLGRPQLELVVAADPCCIYPVALPFRPLRVVRALAALGYCLGVVPSSYSTHCCRTVWMPTRHDPPQRPASTAGRGMNLPPAPLFGSGKLGTGTCAQTVH